MYTIPIGCKAEEMKLERKRQVLGNMWEGYIDTHGYMAFKKEREKDKEQNHGIAEGYNKQIQTWTEWQYSNENGYKVTVNVQDTNGSYDEGYNDGIEEQKSKLTDITITEW